MPRPPRLALAFALVVLTLAGAACARVPPPLVIPDVALGEPAFFPTLEAYTSAPIVGGNALEILLNGEQIFPAKLDAIRRAERTITYAPYAWEDGPVAVDLASALAERCRAGVGVNVLLDRTGTLGMPTAHAELLQRAGCHVAVFPPSPGSAIGSPTRRNHRRILVVDGRVGFTGSSGVGRSWMGDGRQAGHWRDTDVRVEGPVVEYLQGAFAENWLEATGVVLGGEAYFPRPLLPRGPVYAQAVRSSPAGESRAVFNTFFLALSSARRSVYLTTPSLVLDDAFRDALVAAVGRGARVALLIPGGDEQGQVRRATVRRLQRAGVEIHEYRPARLHARTMVVDGMWSAVGTASLSGPFTRHDELTLVVYGAEVAGRLEQVFADDLRHAALITSRARRGRLPHRTIIRGRFHPNRHPAPGLSRTWGDMPHVGDRSREVPRPVVLSSRSDLQPIPSRGHQAINRQEDDGTDHRHDESRRFSRTIEPESLADPAAQQGADDAEHDREDHAARIPTRHEQPGYQPHDEPEHDP